MINKISLKCKQIVQKNAPIDTGNLRYNSVKVIRESDKRFTLYIDTQIAPYMPYTNEKWVAKRWNGKKNPNEGWWQRSFEGIKDFLIHEKGGTEKRSERKGKL